MPVALDSNEIHRYVISTDRSKPIEQRPTLLFHFPTVRETRQIANLFDSADVKTTVDDALKARCDAVRVILAGWENFTHRNGDPVPYDPQKLDEVLTLNDLVELQALLLKDMSQSELEKKRHVLSALSSSENSAPSAPAQSA